MNDFTHPYHAHVYYDARTREQAEALHRKLQEMLSFGTEAGLVGVGRMFDWNVGPHPLPQYEIQFLAKALPQVLTLLEATGLRCLVHPLTDDDLADHTTLATWLGDPLTLDLGVLDPPGKNRGVARFGHCDFGGRDVLGERADSPDPVR